MGYVYLCEHQVMRRRVAVKVLPARRSQDPAALERFRREARAVAQLNHTNIVGGHDIDRDGDVHFLVMEYVDGNTFTSIVKTRGPLNPIRAAHYMRQAALGLQHAHEAGLVHRDVKPSNLLLERSGTVKIPGPVPGSLLP
jgi:serine/threonine protein kinase